MFTKRFQLAAMTRESHNPLFCPSPGPKNLPALSKTPPHTLHILFFWRRKKIPGNNGNLLSTFPRLSLFFKPLFLKSTGQLSPQTPNFRSMLKAGVNLKAVSIPLKTQGPGEVKWVNFHPPFSESPSFFLFSYPSNIEIIFDFPD